MLSAGSPMLDPETWNSVDDDMRLLEADAFFDACFPFLLGDVDEAMLPRDGAMTGGQPQQQPQQQPRPQLEAVQHSSPESGTVFNSGFDSSSDVQHAGCSSASDMGQAADSGSFGFAPAVAAPVAVVAGSKSSLVSWGPPKLEKAAVSTLPGQSAVIYGPSGSGDSEPWEPSTSHASVASQRQGYTQQPAQSQQQRRGKAQTCESTDQAPAAAKPGPKRRTAAQGVPVRISSSVIKDTTKRKKAEIARLEAELQQKLSLASSLRSENQELASKERLLKAQVSARERRLLCESTGGITPHLATLIQGFRSSYNQMIGQKLMEQMPKDPKAFGIKEFTTVWQSFVHEVAELILQPEQNDSVCAVSERICNWIMSVCIYAPSVIQKAVTINLQTGEDLPDDVDIGFWKGLAAKLKLDAKQVNDLRSVFELHGNIIQRTTSDIGGLWRQISQIVDSDMANGGSEDTKPLCCAKPPAGEYLLERLTPVFKQLEAAQRQCSMAHSMLAHLVLAVLTPRQRGILTFHSFPYFPNPKFLLVAVLS